MWNNGYWLGFWCGDKVAQHRPTGSETTPSYAPRSSRLGSEQTSVEDDVDVWRYAILSCMPETTMDKEIVYFDVWLGCLVFVLYVAQTMAICLSVTCQYSVKMAAHILKLFLTAG